MVQNKGNEFQEIKQLREELNKVKLAYIERQKELTCHEQLAIIINDSSKSINDSLASIAKLIPSTWHFPDETSAEIAYLNETFKSNDFKSSEYTYSKPLLINKKEVGYIAVFYHGSKPAKIKEPFLKEEYNLLNTITKTVSLYLEKSYIHQQNIDEKKQYENILKSVNDLVYEITQDGIIKYISPSSIKVLGYRPEELIGKKVFDFVYKEDLEHIFNLYLSDTTPTDRILEYRFNRKDGKPIWMRSTSSVIYNSKNKAIGRTGILYDINDSKNSSIEKDQLYEVVAQSPLSIIMTDIDGNIKYANATTYKNTGYTKEELLGKNSNIFQSGETESKTYKQLWKTIKNGKTWEGILKNKKKNGSLYYESVRISPLKTENKITGFFAIREDITERLTIERTLKESENRLQQIAKQGKLIIWETDSAGVITYVSEIADKVLGWSKEEIENKKTVWDLYPEENRQQFIHEVQSLLKNKEGFSNWESPVQTKNGAVKWTLTTGAPIYAKSGEFLGMRGSSLDITERIRLLEEITEQNAYFKAIISAIPDMMFVVNKDAIFENYYVNENDFLLIPPKKIIGSSIYDVFPKEAADFHLSKFKYCLDNQKPIRFDYAIPIPEKNLYYEASLSPIDNNKVLVLNKNITEAKEQSIELIKLSTAITQSPVITVITNTKGEIEYVNPAFEKVTGYSAQEAIGKNSRFLQSGNTPKEVYQDLWNSLEIGEEWSGEWQNKRKDGSLYWEEVNIIPIKDSRGQILNFLAVKQDISGRKQSEQEIIDLNKNLEEKIDQRTKELTTVNERLVKESKQNKKLQLKIKDQHKRLTQIIEASQIGTWEWNVKTDLLTFNDQLYKNIGYSREEYAGMTMTKIFDYIHHEDQSLAHEAIKQLLSNKSENHYIETEIRQQVKSGGYIWLAERAKVVSFDNDANPEWIFGTAIPIQEQKRLQSFEKEILNTSPLLTGLTSENTDESINKVLERIGKFLNADRSYILEFHQNATIMSNTHEWCNDDITREIENLQNLPTSIVPHWIKTLNQNKPVIVPSVKDLPKSWKTERKLLDPQGVQSFFVVPIFKGKLIGLIGIDNVKSTKSYSDTEINLLRFFADILANIILARKNDLILKQTRENYEAFYNSIDDYLFIFDLHGKIISYNNIVLTKLGYKHEELIGKPIYQTRDHKRWEEAKLRFSRILKGDKKDCNIPLETKDGQIIPVESNIKKAYWNDQEVFYCLGKDMTEQLLSEQKFKKAFNTESAMMVISSLQTGIITDVNDKMLEETGYSRSEIIGKSNNELGIIKDDKLRNSLPKVIANRKPIKNLEIKLYTKHNKELTCLLAIEPIYIGHEPFILTILIDITERRKTEQKFSSAFKLNSAIMSIVSVQDMKFIDVNQAFLDVLGYSKNEITGKRSTEIKLFCNKKQHNEYIDLLRKNGSVREFEYDFFTKSGEKRTGIISSDIIYVGDEMCNLSVVIDITDRKKMEVQLAKANKKANIANKAKSEFLSRMSHELRTPMNSILGFAQLLDMGDLNPMQKRGVNHIIQSGRHLLQLINEILDISRIEAGRLSYSLEPVSVVEAIKESVDVIKPLTQPQNISIELKNELSKEAYIQSDKQRYKQILINILNNAIKYNNTNGSIAINITEQNIDGIPMIRTAIKDTGIGIASEDIKKLFQPFERVGANNTEVEGTGLGLSVVRKITELLDGKVGVSSILGKGSTFWVDFPKTNKALINKKQLEKIKIAETISNQPKEKKDVVLYIEDNKANVELLANIIDELVPNVELISDIYGLKTIELAKKHQPAIIFLDSHLPDIQGKQVLIDIKKNDNLRNIPVVILSADALPQQIDDLMKFGAADYITKPIDIHRIVKLIQKLLK